MLSLTECVGALPGAEQMLWCDATDATPRKEAPHKLRHTIPHVCHFVACFPLVPE